MEFKGTKGKWRLEQSSFYQDQKVIFSDLPNMFEDKVLFQTIKFSTEEEKANAKLIAAAPDLLLALQEILSINDVPFRLTRNKELTINDIARKAIEKALK